MHIILAKLGQADAGDNEAKLMTKLAPQWVRTKPSTLPLDYGARHTYAGMKMPNLAIYIFFFVCMHRDVNI